MAAFGASGVVLNGGWKVEPTSKLDSLRVLAELGDGENRLRMADEPDPRRAERKASSEIAQHRSKPDPLEDRHRDDHARQEGDHRHQIDAMGRRIRRLPRCFSRHRTLRFQKTLFAGRHDTPPVRCRHADCCRDPDDFNQV